VASARYADTAPAVAVAVAVVVLVCSSVMVQPELHVVQEASSVATLLS